MKGDRAGESISKNECNKKMPYSAVVVNDHYYYVSLSLPIFHVSIYDPFRVKNNIGMEIQ